MRLCSQKGDRSRLWISCLRRRWSEPGASPAGTPPRACATGQPEAKHCSPPALRPPADAHSTVPGAMERVAPVGLGPGQGCGCWGPADRGPPLSQAPRAQGWELGLAGSGGPGRPPAPRCLASCSFHLVKASCSIATTGKRCLSSTRPRSLRRGGCCRKDKPRGAKGRVAMRPHRGEQPRAPRRREACTNPGDNVSCLFTGWSRPGWLQCQVPSGLVLQRRE